MKSLIQFAVAIVAAALFLLSPPAKSAHQFAAAGNHSAIPNSCSNPLCTCKACDGETCTCTPQTTFEPLVVGAPPDAVSLLGGKIIPVSMPAPEPQPERFTQPAPAVAQKPAPAPQKAVAASGHYETVYAGFRGRRSYQQWVPAQSQSCGQGCSSGGCAAPGAACSSGSCHAPQQYGSGGGCASCGRGRR